MNTWLLAPDDLMHARVETIGGKAWGLLRLHGLDAPVPPWFVIPSECVAARAWTQGGDLSAVYEKLQRAPFRGVAVRSSATQEDGDARSHAGVYETVFVNTAADLPAALDGVAASLNRGGAKSYTRDAVQSMAIVLQACVDAQCSGTVFSADPAQADPAFRYVEVVRGAGQQLADATHVPARLQLDATTGAVAACTKGAHGPDEIPRALTEALHAWACKLEEAFERALDVEWAWDGEQLWLLQARPITVLHPATELFPDEPCTSWFFDQRFNEPIRPFTAETLLPVIARVALGDALRMRGCDVPEPLLRFHAGQAYAPCRVYSEMLDGAPQWFLSPDLRQALHGGRPFRLFATVRYAWHAARSVLADWVDVMHNLRAWDAFCDGLPERLAAAREHDEDTRLGWTKRWALYDELTERFLRIHRWSILWADYWFRGYTVVKPFMPRSLREAFDRQLHRDVLLSTVAANDALQRALDDPTPEHVGALLEGFGHRSPSLDYAVPTWAEMWRAGTLKARSRASKYVGVPKLELGNERSSSRSGVLSRILFPLRRFLELREEQRFTWERVLAEQRGMVVRLGEQLVRNSDLTRAEDVFFLTREDLLAVAFDGAPLSRREIQQRRRAHRLYAAMNVPPVIGVQEESPRDPDARTFAGIGASPGVVTGTVHVLLPHAPYGLDLPEGVILVARALDPAWTPHLLRARGVILERGGLLSHAAVLAREYGTPLIVGLDDATALLPQGATVTVDGGRGVVTVE